MKGDMNVLRKEILTFMWNASVCMREFDWLPDTHNWIVGHDMFNFLKRDKDGLGREMNNQIPSINNWKVVVEDDHEHPYWIYLRGIENKHNTITLKIEINERDFR